MHIIFPRNAQLVSRLLPLAGCTWSLLSCPAVSVVVHSFINLFVLCHLNCWELEWITSQLKNHWHGDLMRWLGVWSESTKWTHLTSGNSYQTGRMLPGKLFIYPSLCETKTHSFELFLCESSLARSTKCSQPIIVWCLNELIIYSRSCWF